MAKSIPCPQILSSKRRTPKKNIKSQVCENNYSPLTLTYWLHATWSLKSTASDIHTTLRAAARLVSFFNRLQQDT